mmetsp:Transcript_44402/g.142292  ORF Transcript_44402/g.142292 Transcript_44402/m.142292 type:complete len:262 (-) Transcript_44402:1362-2147(-)
MPRCPATGRCSPSPATSQEPAGCHRGVRLRQILQLGSDLGRLPGLQVAQPRNRGALASPTLDGEAGAKFGVADDRPQSLGPLLLRLLRSAAMSLVALKLQGPTSVCPHAPGPTSVEELTVAPGPNAEVALSKQQEMSWSQRGAQDDVLSEGRGQEIGRQPAAVRADGDGDQPSALLRQEPVTRHPHQQEQLSLQHHASRHPKAVQGTSHRSLLRIQVPFQLRRREVVPGVDGPALRAVQLAAREVLRPLRRRPLLLALASS